MYLELINQIISNTITDISGGIFYDVFGDTEDNQLCIRVESTELINKSFIAKKKDLYSLTVSFFVRSTDTSYARQRCKDILSLFEYKTYAELDDGGYVDGDNIVYADENSTEYTQPTGLYLQYKSATTPHIASVDDSYGNEFEVTINYIYWYQ